MIPDVFTSMEEELTAIRTGVAMIDMSPLPKVDFRGRDALRYFDYLSVRSIARNRVGHVHYTCWTDHRGKLVTDGLGFRMAEDHLLVSSDTSFGWFRHNAEGFDVSLVDRTHDYGVLSLQGPRSHAVLTDATNEDWSDLAFCRMRHTTIGGAEVFVARQGFTGELGYEIWVTAPLRQRGVGCDMGGRPETWRQAGWRVRPGCRSNGGGADAGFVRLYQSRSRRTQRPCRRARG